MIYARRTTSRSFSPERRFWSFAGRKAEHWVFRPRFDECFRESSIDVTAAARDDLHRMNLSRDGDLAVCQEPARAGSYAKKA